MLILTRNIGESIRINDDISITVMGVQGNQVRLGADAPREVAVHREEIYRRIQAEKQAKASGSNNYDAYTPKPKITPKSAIPPQTPVSAPAPKTSQLSSYTVPLEASNDYAPHKPAKTPNVIIKKKKYIGPA